MKKADMEARRETVFAPLRRAGWEHPTWNHTWRMSLNGVTVHSSWLHDRPVLGARTACRHCRRRQRRTGMSAQTANGIDPDESPSTIHAVPFARGLGFTGRAALCGHVAPVGFYRASRGDAGKPRCTTCSRSAGES